MSLNNSLEIIDRTGWRIVTTLNKPIVYIGSNPGRDVVLDPTRGSGVSPLHAQMIFSAQVAGCRLVNLGSSEINVGEGVLAPQEVIQIPSEAVIKIGEFNLVLHAGIEALMDLPSVGKNIAIAVSMPFTRLEPGHSLSGSVRVRNQGEQGSVQVDMDIEGLDPACYTIEPGPVLAQGAEKEVAFRIYHRGSQPPAGLRTISFRATSLHAYSGEEVILTQSIQVLPSYTFEMDLLPPGSALPTPSSSARPSSAAQLQLRSQAMKSSPSQRTPPHLQPPPSMAPPSASTAPKTHPYREIWEAAQSPEIVPPAGAEQPALAPDSAPPPAVPPVVAAETERPSSAAALPTTSTRAYVGMQCIPLTPSIVQAMNLPAGQGGMLVIQVNPGGPADQAGLQPGEQAALLDGYQLKIGGDVITAWNEQPVTSIEKLQMQILQSAPEQVVTLAYLRKGQPRQATLTLGAQPISAAPSIIPLQPQPAVSVKPPPPSLPEPLTPVIALGVPSRAGDDSAPKKPTPRRRKPAPAALAPSLQGEAAVVLPPPGTKQPPGHKPAARKKAPPVTITPEVPAPALAAELKSPATDLSMPAPEPEPPPDAEKVAAPPEMPHVPSAEPPKPKARTVEETPPAEDWWSPAAPASLKAPVMKIKAAGSTPPKPATPEKAAQKPAPRKTDDWWGKDIKTLADSAEVIQLKASTEEGEETMEDEEK